MIDISIVIVNYKSWNVLSECLKALSNIKNTDFVFEIIVVDNDSNDQKINDFKNNLILINYISII